MTDNKTPGVKDTGLGFIGSAYHHAVTTAGTAYHYFADPVRAFEANYQSYSPKEKKLVILSGVLGVIPGPLLTATAINCHHALDRADPLHPPAKLAIWECVGYIGVHGEYPPQLLPIVSGIKKTGPDLP